MSDYKLFKGITSSQTLSVINPDGGSNPAVKPWGSGDNNNSPTTQQAFQATLRGRGTVSGSIQIVASNDGVNFANYGSAVTVSGTADDGAPVVATATGSGSFVYYGGYVAAISGTNAAADLDMSA